MIMLRNMLRGNDLERLSDFPRSARWGWASAALALLFIAGCGNYLPTDYGELDARSVNGPDVLVELFRHAGHGVYRSSARLTPRMRKTADVMVWMPDSFKPPTDQERKWLEDWLAAAPGRTLVYIGRDYESGSTYWRRMIDDPRPSPEQIKFYKAELLSSQIDADHTRNGAEEFLDHPWFTFRKGSGPWRDGPPDKPLKSGDLKGAARWIDGLDHRKLSLFVEGSTVDPPFEAEVLLGVGSRPLVSTWEIEAPYGVSRIVLVGDAEFLTNLALVDPGNRELAARLVEEVGDPGTMYFIESSHFGLQIIEEDSGGETESKRTGMEFLMSPRLAATFLHLLVLGVIFSFSRWSIFGRPKHDHRHDPSDFGRHVEALGELLKQGGDAEAAREVWRQYHQRVRGESSGPRSNGK